MTMKFMKYREDFKCPSGAQSDFIEWGDYAEDIELKFSQLKPFAEHCSKGNLSFDITHPSSLRRLTQGDTWDGTFSAGDPVLWTDGNPGPITIRFDKPIRGAGANIDIRNGNSFRVTIKAYKGNNPVALASNGSRDDGKHNNAGDGKAVFAGFLEDDLTKKLGIDAIEFYIELLDSNPDPAIDTRSFAINKLALVLE